MNSIWRSLCVLVFAAAWLTSARDVFADGKVFARATAVVNIPDQEALIHCKDGVETLVIETRFDPVPAEKAPATLSDEQAAAYAWVVPVPGPRAAEGNMVPKVSATTPGVFPTLRAVCAPHVIHSGPGWAAPAVAIALLILGVAWLSGIVARVVFALFFGLVLSLLLTPSLGVTRSSATIDGMQVLDRSIVGSFDVSVVGADSPAAADELRAWLKGEGFYVPEEAGPIITDYASKGWVFVAAKLRAAQPGSAAHLTPHPLAVQFSADGPVYPMRLTAVGNKTLSLDLYVFGDRRAVVPGMTTVRCGPTNDPKPRNMPSAVAGFAAEASRVPIGHPELVRLTARAPVVTKLSGHFAPKEMREDLAITWTEPREVGASKLSARGAAWWAINIATVAWLVSILAIFVVGSFRGVPARRLSRLGMAALVPLLCIAAIATMVIPTVPVEDSRSLRNRNYDRLSFVDGAIRDIEKQRVSADVASLRVAIAQSIAVEAAERWAAGKAPPHEEDSPLNYVVRESTGDDGSFAEIVWFDHRGVEQRLWRTKMSSQLTAPVGK